MLKQIKSKSRAVEKLDRNFLSVYVHEKENEISLSSSTEDLVPFSVIKEDFCNLPYSRYRIKNFDEFPLCEKMTPFAQNVKELILLSSNIKIPKEIANYQNLEEYAELDTLNPSSLSERKLNDEIKLLGQLPSLTSILYSEVFDTEQPFPQEITKLTNLNSISLSNSSLRGVIPREIKKLQNLEYLDLSSSDYVNPKFHNKLEMDVPEEIGYLKNLKHLNLSRNAFTHLPNEIGRLTNLESLLICKNPFDRKTFPKEEIDTLWKKHNLDRDSIEDVYYCYPHLDEPPYFPYDRYYDGY